MEDENKDINEQPSDIKPKEVFINPRSDFGFKRVFYDPQMMMSFLNGVISKRKRNKGFHVTSLEYLPVEHFGDNENDRRVIVDSRCKINTGEDVVVEMQNARPANFVNRLIYYSNYLVHSQIPLRKQKGKTEKKTPAKTVRYDMKAIYIVAIVNFPLIKGIASKDVIIDWIQLISRETKQVWSDKLNFIIVDLTKFNKTEEELKTTEDYWLYSLKYAEKLTEPLKTKNKAINKLFEILQKNKLTQEEMEAYNSSVLEMEQYGLFTEGARIEGEKIGEKRGKKIGRKIGEKIGEKIGRIEGEKIGRVEGEKETCLRVVLNAASQGMSIELIAMLTNLSSEQIREILSERSDFYDQTAEIH
jgi:predicted transposase/invertase (TIGR01784 family)